MEALPCRSWVEISRSRIARNFGALRAALGPEVETACVVKADAYGHGAVEVSRTLVGEGARWLAVSSVEEAEDIAAAIHSASSLDCEGLMTHFASSSDYTSAQTDRQVACFIRTATALRAAGVAPRYLHMASTNPVAYGRHEAWQNMVRPGHALYGYISPVRGAAPDRVLEVHPALTWKAGVLAVKDLPAGAAVGYGAMFHTQRPTRIAILAVGYADGLSHRLGGRGFVIACGKLVPILGAVSMDVTTIDVTDCPELKPGAAVTLLGDDADVSINAQQMARMAGTISYDILCGIRTRVKRLYL